MVNPTSHWLLEPTFPAPPALPRLDHATSAAPTPDGATGQYPSGTWQVGTHGHADADALLEVEDGSDSQRFAKSDSEAPTVRPGALRALKTR